MFCARLLVIALALSWSLGAERVVEAAPRVASTLGQRAPHRGLRLRARLRLARRRIKQSRAAVGLRVVGQRLVVLKKRAAKTRVGRGLAALGRGLGRVTLGVSARLTQGADWVEGHLPSSLGRAFHQARLLDPLTMGAFAFQKIKADPVFFATWGTFSLAFSTAIIPALVGVGVSPVVATAVRFATGTPFDVVALTLRGHARRKDRSQSIGGTFRALVSQYGEFAEQRRTQHRAHLARPVQGGRLAAFSVGLR